MRCIPIRHSAGWAGLVLSFAAMTAVAADPPASGGAPRSLGRPAAAAAPVVTRSAAGGGGAAAGRAPVSIANPRASGGTAAVPRINGTNPVGRVIGASGSPGAGGVSNGWGTRVAGGMSTPVSNGMSTPVINGMSTPVVSGMSTPVVSGMSTPVATGWGSPAGGGWGSPIYRSGLPLAYGGVAINPGPGIVMNRGPADPPRVVNPPSAPVDTNSEWYRRYQHRYDNYPGGNWGSYGPVFLTPSYYYIDQLYASPPVIINNNNQQQQAVNAAEPAAAREEQGPADVREDRQLQRKRPVARFTPEKLHELMVQGTEQFHKGQYSEAAATFLRVTLADRQNVDATLAYAVARFATGDYQVSALAVRRAVRRLPDVVNSNFDVRERYGRLDQFKIHLARLEQFVHDHADDPDGWIVLGFIRHFSGERATAAETFTGIRERWNNEAGVAEAFLAAVPLQSPQSQPAGQVAPMVPPAAASLVPVAAQEEAAETLITIETAK